jgi:hypothetical protein
MAPAFFCCDGLAFRRCLCLSIDFLDGIMLPLKNVGDCHDPRSRRSYYMTSQYQATTPGFEHCSRHFVGPFLEENVCFRTVSPISPCLDHILRFLEVVHNRVQPNWVKIEGPICSANVVLKNVRGPSISGMIWKRLPAAKEAP